jgi:nicotinamide phosphoribosyltransferase
MCAGGKEDEIETFRRLLKTYPTGILSVVSDTWDLWKVCTEHLVTLKDEILARDGKLVIRPDSGNPVDILCGIPDATPLTQHKLQYRTLTGDISWKEQKGVIELLWNVFGGTINEQGYKVLDPHIGAIYGDSITIDRADEICERLEAKGFASTNVVLGIGSFTYQYNTRDTFGFAMKATYVEVNGEGREIFKDPITDDGTKKSATGLLCVTDAFGEYQLTDKVDWDTEKRGELKTIYKDGEFYNQTTLSEIRERLTQLATQTV